MVVGIDAGLDFLEVEPGALSFRAGITGGHERKRADSGGDDRCHERTAQKITPRETRRDDFPIVRFAVGFSPSPPLLPVDWSGTPRGSGFPSSSVSSVA
jgi:hypothetical protein